MQYGNPLMQPLQPNNPYTAWLQGNYNNPYQQRQPTNSGIIWVQGVEGAKAYQLTPNSQAVLLDSEVEGRFYIKTCNDIGMCELHYFNYVEVSEAELKKAAQVESQPQLDLSNYVTWEQLNALLSNFNANNNLQGGQTSAEQTVPATEQQQLITTSTIATSKRAN